MARGAEHGAGGVDLHVCNQPPGAVILIDLLQAVGLHGQRAVARIVVTHQRAVAQRVDGSQQPVQAVIRVAGDAARGRHRLQQATVGVMDEARHGATFKCPATIGAQRRVARLLRQLAAKVVAVIGAHRLARRLSRYPCREHGFGRRRTCIAAHRHTAIRWQRLRIGDRPGSAVLIGGSMVQLGCALAAGVVAVLGDAALCADHEAQVEPAIVDGMAGLWLTGAGAAGAVRIGHRIHGLGQQLVACAVAAGDRVAGGVALQHQVAVAVVFHRGDQPTRVGHLGHVAAAVVKKGLHLGAPLHGRAGDAQQLAGAVVVIAGD